MMKSHVKRNHLIGFVFCICTLSIYSCKGQDKKGQDKMKLDEFEFTMPAKFELGVGQNDENILLTLNDPKGNTIIIQNKLNALKSTFFKNLSEKETLRSMHIVKFDSFIKMLNGYDTEVLKLDRIGKIPFSVQTFKYMEQKIELLYDLRIVQLGNNYYAFYSFDKAEERDRNTKAVDSIIESLSKENFENR